jgi:hypothetical protein
VKVLVATFCFNGHDKIERTVARFPPRIKHRARIGGRATLALGRSVLYALEPYLLCLCQAIRLGNRVVEVPVTTCYPADSGAYSKMRPLLDWWDISKPLIYLALRLKR